VLRRAAEEVAAAPLRPGLSAATALHVRLPERDARRFVRRFERLARDMVAAQDGRGSDYTLAGGIFPAPPDGAR
ncbi:MAG TPA: hypothetical protein VML35_04545, partial [Gaiellaceae bacterium]|nr:hypothetical protein [Gaiellaceae bacterium]